MTQPSHQNPILPEFKVKNKTNSDTTMEMRSACARCAFDCGLKLAIVLGVLIWIR